LPIDVLNWGIEAEVQTQFGEKNTESMEIPSAYLRMITTSTNSTRMY